MDISSNLINEIHNSINHYHHNILEYSENIRRYLHILEDSYTNSYVDVNPVAASVNTASRVNNLPIINTFIQNYLRNRNTYQDVVVRPTNEQIDNATDIVVFEESGENHNTSCPITL